MNHLCESSGNHRGPRCSVGVVLLAATSLLLPSGASAATLLPTLRANRATEYALIRRSVPSRALLAAIARSTAIIPSFSRQTGLACSACHYQFPQLTPFGRMFKLNGYTMSGLKTISAGDSARPSLALSSIPPLSAMIVASLTHTGAPVPAAQNNNAMFPEQASLFLGGAITPRVGTFVQFTYAAQDGAIGIDNVDVRYASHTTVADKDLLFGVTMHNNPTVQDVWNTVPAWSYPFMSSSTAPSPMAGTLLEGTLGQQVIGLGGYALWDALVYTEFTAYRSAQQGTRVPLDSGSENVIDGVIPYARVAFQHEFEKTYVMVGGFGLADARIYPKGVTGATDRYTTLGLDAQVEHKLDQGGAMLVGRTSFIHENETLDATFAAEGAQDPKATLESFRANVTYLPSIRVSGTLGYFSTSGSSDTLRYAPGELTGSRTGRPNSSGFLGEVTFNPWQNTRLGVQYTAYRMFNGASDAYDEEGGRKASHNNTLYLYTWVAF
jgi:hypothetical protein